MKKLMFMLAAFAMVAGVRAASMDWSVSVYKGSADTAYAGYTVYLCETLATDGFKSEADIANYLYGTEGNSGTTARTGGRSPYTYQVIATAGGIDAADEGTKSVYAVIVSKDGNGYWAQSMSGEVYTTATEPTTASLDASTLIKGDYTPWATTPPPGPTPGGIPEPTSGLLLVLGGAMLALRRRRA